MAGHQRDDRRLQGPPRPWPRILRHLAITAASLIILLALAVIIFWLIVRPNPIKLTVESATVRGFNITNDALNATFDLSIRSYNDNHRVSVYYDSIVVTVAYGGQLVAFDQLSPFYQRHRSERRLRTSAVARAVPLLPSVERSLKRDRSAGSTKVEVRVRARIRLKIGALKTRHYTLKAYCAPVLLNFSPARAKFLRVYCHVDF